MRHDLFRFSGNHIPQAAVLISRSDLGTHTGIIYRDNENGGLRRLDFHINGAISSTPWRGQHPHVVLDVDDDDDALSTLASLCRVMAERYNQRPPEHLYGLRRSPNAFINPATGDLYLGDEVGASCASF